MDDHVRTDICSVIRGGPHTEADGFALKNCSLWKEFMSDWPHSGSGKKCEEGRAESYERSLTPIPGLPALLRKGTHRGYKSEGVKVGLRTRGGGVHRKSL